MSGQSQHGAWQSIRFPEVISMKKLLILLIVFAASACSGGSSSSSGMAPGQGFDSQACMNDTIDANSACGHSVAPQFN
ncbi:hypothetical protein PGR10_02900 [Klebsiella sp. 141198]